MLFWSANYIIYNIINVWIKNCGRKFIFILNILCADGRIRRSNKFSFLLKVHRECKIGQKCISHVGIIRRSGSPRRAPANVKRFCRRRPLLSSTPLSMNISTIGRAQHPSTTCKLFTLWRLYELRESFKYVCGRGPPEVPGHAGFSGVFLSGKNLAGRFLFVRRRNSEIGNPFRLRIW